MADHQPDEKTARALAALDTMASLWAIRVGARNAIRLMMSLPDAEDRLVAFLTHAHAEGLYEGRTSLTTHPPIGACPHEERDSMAPAQAEPGTAPAAGTERDCTSCPMQAVMEGCCSAAGITTPPPAAPPSEEYGRFKAWCDASKLEARHDRWMTWQGARALALDTQAIEAMMELLQAHNEVASYRSADGHAEYVRRRDRNIAAWMRVRDIATGAKPPAPRQWLWRVFNQGWPRGHEDSANEWGDFNVISHTEAVRLAGDDENNCYQFVPFLPADPRTAGAPAQRNQCDGCAQGAALRGELHIDNDGRAFMSCQSGRYNSLT